MITGQRGLDVTVTSCDHGTAWAGCDGHIMGQRGLDVTGTSCDHVTAWAGCGGSHHVM